MLMMKLFIIIFSLTGSAVCQAVNQTCCDTGQYIIVNNTNGTIICKDINTNSTSDLNLQCDDNDYKSVISLNKYICNVNEAGDLLCKTKKTAYISTVYKGKFCFGVRRGLLNKTQVIDVRIAALCVKIPTPENISQDIKAYCMIVSVVFLILTSLVYAALPELRDLEGRSIVNLCGSLAVGLGIFAGSILVEYSNMTLCAIRGFLAYFFIVAAFFWMNVISIQILNSIRQSIIRPFAKKEFLCYVVCAWGLPTLLTAVVAIVNYVEGDHYRPGIGLDRCWFFDLTQQWIYFYSVLLIILVINISIFIYTSVYLWKNSFNSNNISALRYKFALSLRMVVIMGLPWIFEMLSSLFDNHIIWDILDIFNMLFGFMIFLLLVVLRQRVIKALHKHGWTGCCSGFVERYLGQAEDLEDLDVQHTAVLPLETNGKI